MDQFQSCTRLDWRTRNTRVIAPLPAETIDEVLQKAGTLLARDE